MSLLAPILDITSKIKKGDSKHRIGDYVQGTYFNDDRYLPLTGGKYLRSAYPKIEDQFKDPNRTGLVEIVSNMITTGSRITGITDTVKDDIIRAISTRVESHFCASASTQIFMSYSTNNYSPQAIKLYISNDGFQTSTVIDINRAFLGASAGSESGYYPPRLVCRLGVFYLSINNPYNNRLEIYKSVNGISWTRMDAFTINSVPPYNSPHIATFMDIETDYKGTLILGRLEPGSSSSICKYVLYISTDNFETFTTKTLDQSRVAPYRYSEDRDRRDPTSTGNSTTIFLKYCAGSWIGLIAASKSTSSDIMYTIYTLDENYDPVYDNTPPLSTSGRIRSVSVGNTRHLPISVCFRQVEDTLQPGYVTGFFCVDETSTPDYFEVAYYNKSDKKFEKVIIYTTSMRYTLQTSAGYSRCLLSSWYNDTEYFAECNNWLRSNSGNNRDIDSITFSSYLSFRITKKGDKSNILLLESPYEISRSSYAQSVLLNYKYKLPDIGLTGYRSYNTDLFYNDGITTTVLSRDAVDIDPAKAPPSWLAVANPIRAQSVATLCILRLTVKEHSDQFELPSTTGGYGMTLPKGLSIASNVLVSGIRDYVRAK